jgi:hypothetical protein
MKEKLNQLYGEIGNQIASMIPVEWDKAYFLGQVEKEQASNTAVLYYVESASGDIIRFNNLAKEMTRPLVAELRKSVLGLYKCFKDEGEELWEQVSISIENTSKYNVKFAYDVFHEDDGGYHVTELVWAYKTFGLIPPEGTYNRQLFDKYVKA